MLSLARVVVIGGTHDKKCFFFGMIDNLKTKHINVLAIQLSCKKLFSSYLGYKNFGDLVL